VEPQPYPTLPVAAQALELGIPLVVNSDSHATDHVGFKFSEVENFLRQHGGRQLARFERRQRSFYALCASETLPELLHHRFC